MVLGVNTNCPLDDVDQTYLQYWSAGSTVKAIGDGVQTEWHCCSWQLAFNVAQCLAEQRAVRQSVRTLRPTVDTYVSSVCPAVAVV